MSRLLRQVLVLFVLVFPAVARAAGWENWFAAGSVLQIGDATVISAGGDGDFAGVHSTAHTGPLQASNVRLSVMSPDWSSVRQLQVLLSTDGNFESVTFTDLRELLLVAPEGEWIELTVPTGAWQSAVRAEEAWVNAVQVRVTAERGRTALVAFRDFGFVPAYQGAGAVTIAFDDARSDVFDYAFSQLQQRGLTGTVYVIPEYVGTAGFMDVEQLLELQRAGWEIGGHGAHHLTSLSSAEREADLAFSSAWLREHGFGEQLNYAYPGGMYDENVQEQVARYFGTARSIIPDADVIGLADRYRLGGLSMYPDIPQRQLEQLTTEAARSGEWFSLVFHLFSAEPEFETQYPPERFEQLLDFLIASDIPVRNARDVWQLNLEAAGSRE